jgi:hypothetical protein
MHQPLPSNGSLVNKTLLTGSKKGSQRHDRVMAKAPNTIIIIEGVYIPIETVYVEVEHSLARTVVKTVLGRFQISISGLMRILPEAARANGSNEARNWNNMMTRGFISKTC